MSTTKKKQQVLNAKQQLAELDKALLTEIPIDELLSDLEEDEERYFRKIIHPDESQYYTSHHNVLGVRDTADSIRKIHKEMLKPASDPMLLYNTATEPDLPMGRCLIINSGIDRKGSEKDVSNLKDLFGKLKFDVKTYELGPEQEQETRTRHKSFEKHVKKIWRKIKDKMDHQETDEEDEEEASDGILRGRKSLAKYQQELHTGYSKLSKYKTPGTKQIAKIIADEIAAISEENNDRMFVLVLMAHGDEGELNTDSGDGTKLSDIYQMLSKYNFPAMEGKPKWVIVQACSGGASTQVDKATKFVTGPVPTANTRENNGISPSVTQSSFSEKKMETDDITAWLSTFPGKVSFRNEERGSWFVRTIIDVVVKHSHHMHLREMFQRVQDKVRQYGIWRKNQGFERGGQHPIEMCTFPEGKRVYLFPGLNNGHLRD